MTPATKVSAFIEVLAVLPRLFQYSSSICHPETHLVSGIMSNRKSGCLILLCPRCHLAGAGRTAHEAAESVKQEGQGAKSAVKQAGEALEEGFVAAVQAPRHLAETVKRQVGKSPFQLDPRSEFCCAFGVQITDCLLYVLECSHYRIQLVVRSVAWMLGHVLRALGNCHRSIWRTACHD